MTSFDVPTHTFPLIPSYDTRSDANTKAQAGVDQRKVNCMYDHVVNETEKKITPTLIKRPGVSQFTGVGTNAEEPHLMTRVGSGTSAYWLINISGGNIRASNDAGDNTILSSSSGAVTPCYITLTRISGAVTAVLQANNLGADTSTVWFASAIGSWTQITDGDFTGLTLRGQMEHIDGYALALDSMGRVYNSDLNSLSNWPGTYLPKQIQQDSASGLARFKNQILAFGDNTVEVIINNGNASGSPLATVPDRAAKVGLALGPVASRTLNFPYYCTVGERMYFAGHAGSAKSAVDPVETELWMYDGERFEHVSSPPMDRMMSESGIYSVHAMNVFGNEAVAINLTAFSNATQRWLMFFPRNNEWFEWTSTEFSPINYEGIHAHVKGAARKNLYYFNQPDDFQDNGTNITATLQFSIPHKPGNNFMKWLELDADTPTTGSVDVSFSDADYSGFTSAGSIDLTATEKRLTRCGSYKGSRKVRFAHSSNGLFRARAALMRIE